MLKTDSFYNLRLRISNYNFIKFESNKSNVIISQVLFSSEIRINFIVRKEHIDRNCGMQF